MKKIPAKCTATAALFTAISEVLYQMSGDLNGSAAHFAAHILLGFKNLAKVRLCRNNIRIFDLKTAFFHANIWQCRKFARFTTPFWQKTANKKSPLALHPRRWAKMSN